MKKKIALLQQEGKLANQPEFEALYAEFQSAKKHFEKHAALAAKAQGLYFGAREHGLLQIDLLSGLKADYLKAKLLKKYHAVALKYARFRVNRWLGKFLAEAVVPESTEQFIKLVRAARKKGGKPEKIKEEKPAKIKEGKPEKVKVEKAAKASKSPKADSDSTPENGGKKAKPTATEQAAPKKSGKAKAAAEVVLAQAVEAAEPAKPSVKTAAKAPAATAEKAEVRPKPATKPKSTAHSNGESAHRDDLKRIEGIGQKVEQLLLGANIMTFRQLAETPTGQIREILAVGGSRFSFVKPDTWPKQAELANLGKWDELAAWQKELKGGKAA